MNPTLHRFGWSWQGQAVEIGYDVAGAGTTLLLLPAFSTVSSRAEMYPLARALGEGFRIIMPDWPGFGDGPTQRLPHSPALHLAFLREFCDSVVRAPAMVVAAGHAAGYALALGSGTWRSIALIAPTWRGPLPTMMGGYKKTQTWVRRTIEMPVIGPLLYRLNVSRPVIAMMYRRHVYADPSRVTPAFVAEKAAVAHRRDGRFATAAFVTGGLDLVHERAGFLETAQQAGAPIFVVSGADTPPRSLAEIDALGRLSGVISKRLPTGSLGLHEEQAEQVAGLVGPFLRYARAEPTVS